jgi:hypothetical protein
MECCDIGVVQRLVFETSLSCKQFVVMVRVLCVVQRPTHRAHAMARAGNCARPSCSPQNGEGVETQKQSTVRLDVMYGENLFSPD